MLRTPDEARFVYCPLLTTRDDKLKFCQAAMCMMWRTTGDSAGPDAPGFCGLAGSPLRLRKSGSGAGAVRDED